MSKSKELAKNTAIIAAGKISTQFLTFLLLPLYTTLLRPDDFGVVDLILTYVAIATPLVALSVERALFRYLIDNRKNKKIQSELVRNTFDIYMIGYVALAVLFSIFNYFYPVKYGWLVYCVILFVSFSNYLMQIARGLGDNVKFSVASLIVGTGQVVASVFLIVFLRFGAEALLISVVFGNLLGCIYLSASLDVIILLKRGARTRRAKARLLRYSTPLVPSTLAWWGVNAFSRTIIAVILGATSNGIYAVASKFPAIFSSLFGFFSLAWVESASVHINSKEASKFYTATMDNTVRVFGSLCLLITAGVAVFFSVLIGSDYANARIYIPVMMIGTLFYATLDVYSGIYIAKKMTGQIFTTAVIAAAISITFTFAFINHIGLFAPAIGSGLGYLIMSILRHFDLKKYVHIKYNMQTVLLVSMWSILVIGLYYVNNIFTDILSLVVAVIASVLLNKKIIVPIFLAIKNR